MSSEGDPETCPQCAAQNGKVGFIEREAVCMQCQRAVSRILDLHHTRAPLCSLECERRYWLDILY